MFHLKVESASKWQTKKDNGACTQGNFFDLIQVDKQAQREQKYYENRKQSEFFLPLNGF